LSFNVKLIGHGRYFSNKQKIRGKITVEKDGLRSLNIILVLNNQCVI